MIQEKKMPTPELQAAYDDAYMRAVQGPAFWGDEHSPKVHDPTSREQVLLQLAWQMGRLHGMDDWALKNGVQTSSLGHGPAGHS